MASFKSSFESWTVKLQREKYNILCQYVNLQGLNEKFLLMIILLLFDLLRVTYKIIFNSLSTFF